jgi:hypothetical protein
MMILKTESSHSKNCSSTPEPLVKFAPKWYMIVIQNMRRGESIPARLALRVVISIAGVVSAPSLRE